MTLPDANVLIYAFRSDSKDHPRYLSWVEQLVNGDRAYGLCPQVLSSVIRITTNTRVFAVPSGLDEAIAFCGTLIGQPHCRIITPGPRHWALFTQLCHSSNARGNLVQDAWFAALAIESGCEWVTTDRDYARFPGLVWRPPF